MDCKHIREQLHRSLDGNPADSTLREHLSACPDCRNELAAMRQVVTGLNVLPRATAPANLMAGVMAAVRQQPLEDVRARRQRWALTVVAASLALAGLLLLTLAAGDVWEALTLANRDVAVTTQADLATDTDLTVQAANVDPVTLAEQLPAAAESGGVAFAGGLCLLFLAGTTELLSLLLPGTRPAASDGPARTPSPFQPSQAR
jgi:predicted anti-sigma-YlaC factor YlaD